MENIEKLLRKNNMVIHTFCSLHGKLQDSVSRDIFWKRLRFDLEPTLTHVLELDAMSELYTAEEKQLYCNWRMTFRQLTNCGKKILLYGAGAFGNYLGGLILRDGSDFFGYVDRAAEIFPSREDVLWNKPVLHPDYLFAHMDECFVIITTTTFYREIREFLKENYFRRIIFCPSCWTNMVNWGWRFMEGNILTSQTCFRRGRPL